MPAAILLLYLLLWAPLVTVEPPLTPGDMGRDLYAAWMAFEGKWPCRDYWWQYGPLMPSYYASWFHLAGVNLLSIRIGLGILLLLTSLISYGVLRCFTSRPVAFLASLAFLSLDVTYSLGHIRLRDLVYTFNHLGTFPFLFLSIASLWKYFQTREIRWGYGSAAALIGVSLVKYSASLTSLGALLVSLFVSQFVPGTDRSKSRLDGKHFFLIPLLVGGFMAGTYGFLYHGISSGQVNQCLTMGRQYAASVEPPLVLAKNLVQWFLFWDRERLIWLAGFFFLGFMGILGLGRGSVSQEKRGVILLAAMSAFFFGSANSLEYFLVLDGSIHRVDFWFFPMLVLLMGLWAEWASRLFSRGGRIVLWWLTFFAMLTIPAINLREARAWRTPERYLDLPHGRVYLGGSQENVGVIREASRWIARETGPEDEILAIPYDPLYCFLAGRRQAVPELNFLAQMHFSSADEERIIGTLDSKKVPVVLLSNRSRSGEGVAGELGKTHLKRLEKYLFENYEEVKTFGPWEGNPLREHAVKIFRRLGQAQ